MPIMNSYWSNSVRFSSKMLIGLLVTFGTEVNNRAATSSSNNSHLRGAFDAEKSLVVAVPSGRRGVCRSRGSAGQETREPSGRSDGDVRRRKDSCHPVQPSFRARAQDLWRAGSLRSGLAH